VATLDTNVVVRLVVKDDPEQSRLAEGAWRSALAEDGAFLSKVVLVETSWVLRVAYRFDAEAIASTLTRLLSVDGVKIEDEDEIRRALALYERGDADFSDFVILESARQVDALPVKTFDRRFGRTEGVETLSGENDSG